MTRKFVDHMLCSEYVLMHYTQRMSSAASSLIASRQGCERLGRLEVMCSVRHHQRGGVARGRESMLENDELLR